MVSTILCMVQVQYYKQILDLKLEFMMKSPNAKWANGYLFWKVSQHKGEKQKYNKKNQVMTYMGSMNYI